MSRILIVYYSATGRTRQVAELIQKTIGGNLVSIRTKVLTVMNFWHGGKMVIGK